MSDRRGQGRLEESREAKRDWGTKRGQRRLAFLAHLSAYLLDDPISEAHAIVILPKCRGAVHHSCSAVIGHEAVRQHSKGYRGELFKVWKDRKVPGQPTAKDTEQVCLLPKLPVTPLPRRGWEAQTWH